MSLIFSACCWIFSSRSLARSIFMALSRFWNWLRSVWQKTTMPVGRWVRRTAEEVLLMCWPPAPEERQACISMSSGRISTSMSSGSSGITSTAANEVCRRALASKGDTRTSRCTPFSLRKKP